MRATFKPQSFILVGVMLFIGVLLAPSFVSAAPPILSTVQAGSLEIIAPSFTSIPQSTSFDMYWHLFNTTTKLTNTTATCAYHLYSKFSSGEHVYYNNNVTKMEASIDFEVSLSSGNFTQQGEYCHMIECWTTSQTGGLERCFIVTQNGYDFTIQKVYLYVLGLIFLILMIIGLSIIMNKLPTKDAVDEEGTILQVSNLKHLRDVIWIAMWGISLGVIFVLSNIFLAYLDSPMLGNLFFAFYKIMFWITIIGVPVSIILIIIRLFKNKEMQDMINRGVDIKGTP